MQCNGINTFKIDKQCPGIPLSSLVRYGQIVP